MTTRIAIIGAGPAGLAAAHAAAREPGLSIAIVDDNPLAGGQIWRGGLPQQRDGRARVLWQDLQAASNVRFLPGTRVLMQAGPDALLVQDAGAAQVLHYGRLVLATGALLLAIAANIYCVSLVFRRHRHALRGDWPAFERADHLQHKIGAVVLLGILGALGLGLALFAGAAGG